MWLFMGGSHGAEQVVDNYGWDSNVMDLRRVVSSGIWTHQ